MIDHLSGSLPQDWAQAEGEGTAKQWSWCHGAGWGVAQGIDGPLPHWEITQKENRPAGSAFHARSALPSKTIIEPSMKRDKPSRQGDEIWIVNHVFSWPELNSKMATQRTTSWIIGVEEGGRIDTCWAPGFPTSLHWLVGRFKIVLHCQWEHRPWEVILLAQGCPARQSSGHWPSVHTCYHGDVRHSWPRGTCLVFGSLSFSLLSPAQRQSLSTLEKSLFFCVSLKFSPKSINPILKALTFPKSKG